jgi:hypothetical protein
MRTHAFASVLGGLLVVVAGCGDHPSAPGNTIHEGVWGGPGLEMTVGAGGATLDFGCDAGRIERSQLPVESGTFRTSGTYAFGRGGPIDPGAPPIVPQAAEYSGAATPTLLRIRVTLPHVSRTIGEFTVELGRRGTLERCV